MVLFPVNSSALLPEQGMRLDAIEEHINRLQEIASALGRQIHVTLYGRADQTGAETKNAALSKERAQVVLEALRERGIAPDMVTAVGLGDSDADSARIALLPVGSQPQCFAQRPVATPGRQAMIQKKICMLGSFGVGKTSLVARFVHGIFSAKYLSTVGVKIDKREMKVGDKDVLLTALGPGGRGLPLAGANLLPARRGGIFSGG